MICDRCKEEIVARSQSCPYPLSFVPRLVFETLKARLGRPVSRETVMHLLYSGRGDPPSTRAVDMSIHKIRAAAGADYEIQTCWGQGWVMRART